MAEEHCSHHVANFILVFLGPVGIFHHVHTCIIVEES